MSEYDSDYYDVEAIEADKANGNFNPEYIEDYRYHAIVRNSMVNGQFRQAQKQCVNYGMNYELELYKFNESKGH